MAGEGTQSFVLFSAGGKGREELFWGFRETLGEVRDAVDIPVMCGVLPRRDVGGVWFSHPLNTGDSLWTQWVAFHKQLGPILRKGRFLWRGWSGPVTQRGGGSRRLFE